MTLAKFFLILFLSRRNVPDRCLIGSDYCFEN
jgi:hypothetical protein